VLSVLLCCFLLWPIYVNYRDVPTFTTVVSTNYPVWNIEFPAVTVCSNNKVIMSRLEAARKKFNK
jgi:amiloride-sensitive sodium channel